MGCNDSRNANFRRAQVVSIGHVAATSLCINWSFVSRTATLSLSAGIAERMAVTALLYLKYQRALQCAHARTGTG